MPIPSGESKPVIATLGGLSGTSALMQAWSLAAGISLVGEFSGVLLALCWLVLAAGMFWSVRQRPGLSRQQRLLGLLLCLLSAASGTTYAIAAIAPWYPLHLGQALALVGTAIVMAVLLLYLRPLLPEFLPPDAKEPPAVANHHLRRTAAERAVALRELESVKRDLEEHLAEQGKELGHVKAAFETATRGAEVYVFSQDKDLRYTWVFSPNGQGGREVLGRTDEEILPSTERDTVIATKRRVLATGKAEDCEVSYAMTEGRVLFALHVEPLLGADGTIEGITSAAVDLTRIRLLESEQRRLSGELAAILQRYQIALRRSNVTVFTQDRDLRYTSISKPMFGLAAGDILNRTDADILPADSQTTMISLKRRILETGQAEDSEVSVQENAVLRWYDVHIEPLRDVTGQIVGIVGAAVDVTGRKDSEAQLRLLMRELTHRSKNLLAVIQAMARQTGRDALSVDAFLDQFGARLQALAMSHDLLIQESWYGASLYDLVKSQIGHYLDNDSTQVEIDGPTILLRPEAAQNLGLALHELATNAAKYGALSVGAGHVSVRWRKVPAPGGESVEVAWVESGGPEVVEPSRSGFGLLVIKRNLARTLDTDVDLSFGREGVKCQVLIPPSQLAIR